MSKDPCRPHTGNTQWSMWVCLLTWDCLSHYNFHNMAYKKVLNHVKWGVELKMNWLNWSIPISSGFQFQFNSNSKSFNSIPIQFMLNWIELIINSNSIHELIRALNGIKQRYPTCWLCQYSRFMIDLLSNTLIIHLRCSANAIIRPIWLLDARMLKTIPVAIKLT